MIGKEIEIFIMIGEEIEMTIIEIEDMIEEEKKIYIEKKKD